jgi:RNA polymerase sigma-70 factor (ECF subfamily)
LNTKELHKQNLDTYKEYSADIFRYAFSLLKNKADAEDVMHDVFLKYIDSINSFNNECSVKTWLLVLTRNKCFNILAQKKVRPSADAFQMETEYRLDCEDKISLEEALLKMPAEDNELLYLKEYAGFSYAEISELTGLTLSNVKIKLFRARTLLRKLLLDDEI